MGHEPRGVALRMTALFLVLFTCLTISDYFIDNPVIHILVGFAAALVVAPLIRVPLDRHIARTTDKDTQ